ncbi:MAG: hypothetical protein A3I05_02340 [Deltaproteobacteria bacterium RIFCSPLOWO2_02_FULL_44_10]|nr:MAG: hypothetical protein A3I05_02340 [Deltaproteobacteria bacterium RIFCSPLOWO2_02_FULL_44_10]
MNQKKSDVENTVVTSIEKLEQEDPDRRAYILFLSGPLQGKLFCLDPGTTLIGRGEDANIIIHDSRISRHHFQVDLNEGVAQIQDLGSTNGTFINGKRVTTHELKNGDKIQISSSTVIKFAYGDKGERMFHDEFYHMANFDAVTSVYNKRFFIERFREELSHARRARLPLSLFMIDIDYFKNVNDTYGHLAGDFVLSHIATKIKSMIRNEDILCRYGGEEFALILRGTDHNGALLLAERIRVAVGDTFTEFEAQQISVTISTGVATLHDDNFKNADEFIAKADAYLYKSKQQGRNCVTAEGYPS